MITCKWFYRARETILQRRRPGVDEQQWEQELFQSEVIDENLLCTVEGLADVRSTKLIDNLPVWVRELPDASLELPPSPRFYYSKKYLPSSTQFRDLTIEDDREAAPPPPPYIYTFIHP
jgi:hypothetical protein